MKKIFTLCAMLIGLISGSAQTVIDNFIVGPYIVDYSDQGDVKYRLQDNIDLYDFFELSRDTTVMVTVDEPIPVMDAFQLTLLAGTKLHSKIEYGLEGYWKHYLGSALYFNGGLSMVIDNAAKHAGATKRTMLEVGVPLQIELGNLYREKASLYELVGITPTYYSTMSAEEGSHNYDGDKFSGFMMSVSAECGGNIPLGNYILRIGAYGGYKVNCSDSDYDVYKNCMGRFVLGGKISLVF